MHVMHIHFHVCRMIYSSIYTHARARMSIYLSIYLSTYLSVHLSIYLSIHLSIHPSIHLSIYTYMIYYPYLYVRTDRPLAHTPHHPRTDQPEQGHGQNSHAPEPTYRTLFPPTDVGTPVCVPLQRRGGAGGNDGAGRSVPPAVQTEAAREAAIAEIHARLDAIARSRAGPMSHALDAEAEALRAKLRRTRHAPTVRMPARCRFGWALLVWPCLLAPCVRVQVCISLCVSMYRCAPYASMSVHYGCSYICSHRQTSARTYAHAHAPGLKHPLSAH
jgi:hypothetical protein